MAGAEVRRLKCVGSINVPRQTQLGFMCGTLPVPTSSTSPNAAAHQKPDAVVLPAISLQSQRSLAPRYWLLPAETDLNTLPSDYGFQYKELMPLASILDPTEICDRWSMSYISRSLAWKCDTLAVHAIAGYGDEIDVVAPVDILKQIFKTPYSKARLSVVVHRIGRTLVLNSGPETEEAEKLVNRKKTQAKVEKLLFSNFVQYSTHVPHEGQVPPPVTCSRSKSPPACSRYGKNFSGEPSGVNFHSSPMAQHQHAPWQVIDTNFLGGGSGSTTDDACATSRIPSSRSGKQRVSWSCASQARRGAGKDSIRKSRLFGEEQHEPDDTHQDAEAPHPAASEGFLRVLFWQFQNLRMLLGSDLLVFSNDKHVAVSLHLLDLERQVTPLMWLDTWLDNIMASVPELAICYHRNGVVQGYELLKTDDIFLVKGLAEDGTAFFQPHLVQQNAMSVLRFLKENCKQDPGTYWLFKNAGKDLLQLFDLTVMSKPHSSCVEKDEKQHRSLPTLKESYGGCYSLPLAMLLYRIAQRLSQSKDPVARCKCARLFQKCLEFLDEEEHLVMRASAHEQVARLILNCCKEQESVSKPLLLEFIKTEHASNGNVKEHSDKILLLPSKSIVDEVNCNPKAIEKMAENETLLTPESEENNFSVDELKCSFTNLSSPSTAVNEVVSVEYMTNAPEEEKLCSSGVAISHEDENSSLKDKNELVVCTASTCSSDVVLPDSVSARLAAVHHVSQAILSLRSQRQLNDTAEHDSKLSRYANGHLNKFPLCLCGEIECFTLCDLSENELSLQMDQKLWKLVLLLGESYLALGQAYQEECQLGRALQAVELACTVYGSMHHNDKEKTIVSSVGDWHDGVLMTSYHNLGPTKSTESLSKDYPCLSAESKLQEKLSDGKLERDSIKCKENSCPTYRGVFWGQAWTLLGDIYVDRSRFSSEEASQSHAIISRCGDLQIAKEVAKEVKRLKKKITQRRSCAICSLTNCSCQTDRVNSGSAASSSSSNSSASMSKHTRKYGTKSGSKNKHSAIVSDNNCTTTSCDSVGIHDMLQIGASLSNLCATEKASLPHIGPLESTDFCKSTQTDVQRSCIEEDKEQSNSAKDVFWFIKRSLTPDAEINLSIAVECYELAATTLDDLSLGSQDLVSVLRKKGWACNELGRRRLLHGDIKLAEATFDIAIRAFRKVGDFTNIILVNCNLGHSRRASAEALASQITQSSLEGVFNEDDHVHKVARIKCLYLEALKFYTIAKQELKNLAHACCQSNDLHNEVLTQLAHTYLRLGMFLSREQYQSCNLDGRTKMDASASRGRTANWKLNESMLDMTAGDAIREALLLYESLGTSRAQEAAYSHFQLACYHRDLCQRTAASKGQDAPFEVGGSCFQRLKRYFSLADRHWQKALEFYKADTYPDVFLEIVMKRASLNLLVASPSMPNQVADVSLSHLLEGRLAFPAKKFNPHEIEAEESDACPSPSPKVAALYCYELQTLLRKMLANALAATKSTCSGSSHMKKNVLELEQGEGQYQTTTHKWDIPKVKDMYRLSLKASVRSDFENLYNLWLSSG